MRAKMIPIIYEDTQIIVCHKQAGVPVQTAKLTEQDMVSMLKNHLAGKREGEPYLGLVHRLDQPVEGVMVFAKTPAAAGELSRQAADGTMKKYYYAITAGELPERSGILENYLLKDGRNNTSAVVDKGTKHAKAARLSYTLLRRTEAGPLYEVELHTGRHHQIRVQLAHAGAPILGDAKYGQGGGRLYLCAFRLVLRHPAKKEWKTFEINPGWE